MKSILNKMFIFCIAFPLFFNAYALETYKLDNSHTSVTFHINHFGFSNPSGKWYADGTLLLDEKNPENSKLDVLINTASLNTGIDKLDEHLKSKDFFDVKQFPTATFISNKIILTGKDSAKVRGSLTLHGITKAITLDVKLNKIGVSPVTNIKTAGFTATTILKRSDFGIDNYLPNLSNEVKLNIEAEAILQK
jgi:polyisoprenoid-binding protein YceI